MIAAWQRARGYNLSTWEAEEGGVPQVQSQLDLRLNPCVKKTKAKQNLWW